MINAGNSGGRQNRYNPIILNYKASQTIIAMANESKVTELFSMADDFGKFFDAIRAFSANTATNGKHMRMFFKNVLHVFQKHADVLAGA